METALIKKAKQSLQCSCDSNMAEKSINDVFSKLPNSASFHITFENNGACVPKWLDKKHLQESITFNSDLLIWIQSLKRNKNPFHDVEECYVHLLGVHAKWYYFPLSSKI